MFKILTSMWVEFQIISLGGKNACPQQGRLHALSRAQFLFIFHVGVLLFVFAIGGTSKFDHFTKDTSCFTLLPN
jgi:hypothetical protein